MAKPPIKRLLDERDNFKDIQNAEHCDWVNLIRDHDAFRILHTDEDGGGTEELYSVRENVLLRVLDECYECDTVGHTLTIPEHLTFSFKLEGKNIIELSDGQKFEMSPGSLIMGFSPETQLLQDQSFAGRYTLVMISMKPAALLSPPFSFSSDSLPSIIKNLYQNVIEKNFVTSLKFDTKVQSCLQDLLLCTLYGSIRRAYIEAKVIELICLSMDILTRSESREYGQGISTKDNKSLEKIRFTLQNSISSPPSLKELASSVSMSESKLKRSFKSLFGMTTSEYVQEARMSRAQELLNAHEGNINFVANALGYDYASSFITAFKRHYGLTPKTYQTLSVHPTEE